MLYTRFPPYIFKEMKIIQSITCTVNSWGTLKQAIEVLGGLK